MPVLLAPIVAELLTSISDRAAETSKATANSFLPSHDDDGAIWPAI
jgi:hypothetical protein